MARFMARFNNYTYALLRIVTGLLFLFHGSQKLLGFPGSAPDGIPPFILYVSGPIELIGGALVMIGLFTRWAAFFCSGLMAAAYWMAHATKANASEIQRLLAPMRSRSSVMTSAPHSGSSAAG